jgi:hypothetical protein
MIGLRRDGQVDHRTLVRNIITVLRRPELPPLDFDDGVLGLFLANSEADKMDMDSMVGDIGNAETGRMHRDSGDGTLWEQACFSRNLGL